jgi:hypothetical protein
MPGQFDGRGLAPGGASPENWLAQVMQYMGTQNHVGTDFGMYLCGGALQWWATVSKRARLDGVPLTMEHVQAEFVRHYGDPLKFEPDWARDQLHAGQWWWQPGKELLAAYNLRVRELFTHAGSMEEADQVAWYLTGLRHAPHMRQKCNRDRGQPWGSLDALIAYAVQEDLAYRAALAARKSDKPSAVRVAAVRAAQGKRAHPGGGGPAFKKAKAVGASAAPAKVFSPAQQKNHELCQGNGLCRHCHKPWDNGNGHTSVVNGQMKLRCPAPGFASGCSPTCPACIGLKQGGFTHGLKV